MVIVFGGMNVHFPRLMVSSSSPSQLSASCPCPPLSASFCSLDGAGPGPVLNADCEDEVAPPLVDGLGISSVEHCRPALPWVELVVHLEMLSLQVHLVLQWGHLVPMMVLHCSMHPVHPAICCR